MSRGEPHEAPLDAVWKPGPVPRGAEAKPEPVALVDLDGTLADFDGAMKAALDKLRGPHDDPKHDETAYEDLPHMKARRRLIKRLPGFWRGLARLPLGFEVLEELRTYEFRMHVLSKGPANVAGAWAEKVEWCREHVPELPIILSEDKGLVYGKVLVDDWPPYVLRWLEWRPRGLVVMVAQPWNTPDSPMWKRPGTESWWPWAQARCLRYDGTNREELQHRLSVARATAGD